jgi:hypothetical protein
VISEGILAHASASGRSLARLVGSSDKEPSLRQSTGSKGRGSGVDTDKREQRLALWEILVTLLVIFVRELVCDLLLGNYRGAGPITC